MTGRCHWVNLSTPQGDRDAWDIPDFSRMLEKIIQLFKCSQRVHSQHCYLLGEGRGGSAVLRFAPEVRHYLAGAAAINCNPLASDFLQNFVNFPLIVHFRAVTDVLAYERYMLQFKSATPESYRHLIGFASTFIEQKHAEHARPHAQIFRQLCLVGSEESPAVLNWLRPAGCFRRSYYWVRLCEEDLEAPGPCSFAPTALTHERFTFSPMMLRE